MSQYHKPSFSAHYTLEVLSEAAARLTQEILELVSNSQQSQHTIDYAAEQHIRDESHITDLRFKNLCLKRIATALQATLERAKLKQTLLTGQRNHAERRLQEIQREMETTHETIRRQAKQLETLRTQFDAFANTAAVSATSPELTTVKTELSDLHERHKVLREQHEQTLFEKAHLQREIATLKIDQKLQATDTTTEAYTALTQQLQTVTGELESRRKQVQELTELIQQQQRALSEPHSPLPNPDIPTDAAALLRENEQLRDRLKKLESEVLNSYFQEMGK
ncbi:MAG: hypothetical protein A3J38_06765 [Gammaproteobacteria bacterium RIFCSPHIGHO2_12_FULL_45_9]|nr:MAG: hypothetical protein A3J38_06765 [Gammaproteobacteria bacterium RIFCSPHIGHO2_12_FULL_45_9]